MQERALSGPREHRVHPRNLFEPGPSFRVGCLAIGVDPAASIDPEQSLTSLMDSIAEVRINPVSGLGCNQHSNLKQKRLNGGIHLNTTRVQSFRYVRAEGHSVSW